jgi:hypothetical protein
MRSKLLLLTGLLGSALAQVDDFSCPDEFEGFYPHLYSCDKYWHCQDGLAEERLCGNGLGFLDTDPTFTLEQCAELHLVECGERTELEPAISTPNCPRLYGTFADPADCGIFWKCQDGKANRYNCPPGLAYDQVTRGCKWADQVPECSSPVVQIDEEGGEFQCPTGSAAGTFTKHPHPADCRQYFLCIQGQPREYGCPLGEVFSAGSGNGIDGKCTGPEEVPECRDYYGDEELPALKKQVEISRSSGDRVRNSNSIPRAPSKVTVDPVREVVREKARPAPPALQAIVDGGSRASPPRFSPGRGRPARPQARPEPVVEEPVQPAQPALPPRLSIVTTERPARIQVLTDKPTTAFTFESPTTTTRFTTVNRPETAAPTFPSTVARLQPTEPPTQPPPPPPASAPELIDLPDDSGLPPPSKAAPGPNGEEYYYYYYYYDEEEGGGEAAQEDDFSS